MPRVYEVIAKEDGIVLATRYAATAALAKDTKNELIGTFELKKSAVEVEQIEIPAPKADFLEWLNDKIAEYDRPHDSEAE